jgi:hypothetical protein
MRMLALCIDFELEGASVVAISQTPALSPAPTAGLSRQGLGKNLAIFSISSPRSHSFAKTFGHFSDDESLIRSAMDLAWRNSYNHRSCQCPVVNQLEVSECRRSSRSYSRSNVGYDS